MPLEKPAGIGLWFGEEQRRRHVIEGSAAIVTSPDVLSRESV